MRRRARRAAAVAAAGLAGFCATPGARAAEVSQELRFRTSDGVTLRATISGEAPLAPRPTVVEFTPYGAAGRTADPGPAYNYLLVQIRGTGASGGRFDALGPRTQADVAEALGWACREPWSNGTLGVFGFSASAITFFNSLHQELPCVKAAVTWSGTHELYRDLLYPGGIPNLAPGLVVLGGIGGPAIADPGGDPASTGDAAQGALDAFLGAAQHPTLDDWWRERHMRGDVNDLPILLINGFFDVESRGAFQAYQELRGDGAHLMVIGAHDGVPSSARGEREAAGTAWFDRHLRGAGNGVEHWPRVRLWMADGDREDLLAGRLVRHDADEWPVPGTRWEPLALDPARSGSARSLNDGSLGFGPPTAEAVQSYPAVPSLPNASDQPNVSTVGFNFMTDMALAERLGLSYTTPPFESDVLSAGPASLELRLASTDAQSDIWVVVSDVSPDGVPHPVASGRLRTAYPDVDESRSLRDPRTGAIVQPYARFDAQRPAARGEERLYRVELWPIGNRFKRGHRLRLHVVGPSALSAPGGVALNSARVGGDSGSRLLLPVLPGSDLRAALSAPPEPEAGAATPRILLTVSPRRAVAGRRVRVRARVRSSGPRCVRRAVVRLAGRRARTDSRGRASLVVRLRRPGRRYATATKSGCRRGRAALRIVRRSR